MEDRLCIECGTKIHGRVDKKFCCDQCRSAYNNRQNTELQRMIRSVNGILKKNRKILRKLCPGQKASVSRKMLTEAGFNFNYHTNTYVTRKGSTYFFCYDMGYLITDKGSITVVERKEYVK